ncbi:hypothetical protein V1511DRAFT_500283 [Dipodascopsis uninucleata]
MDEVVTNDVLEQIPPTVDIPRPRSGSPGTDGHIRSRPRTFPYSNVLPYKIESDSTRIEHLNVIVEHIYIAASTDSLSTPSIIHWTRELRSWISLKFDMPVSIRSRLSGVYYELALSQGTANNVTEKLIDMFMLLAKKKGFVDQHQLLLEWRTLYNEFKRLTFPSTASYVYKSQGEDVNSLLKMSYIARRFFSAESRLDILQEVLPLYNTIHSSSALNVTFLLQALLPTDAAPEGMMHLYPQEWLPSLFHIWSLYTRSHLYDERFLDIMSRIARGHLQEEYIPFSTCGVFTPEQTSYIFTVALRLIEVPVGRAGSPYISSFDVGSSSHNEDSKKSICARSLARWIVNSLSEASLHDEHSILNGLRGLIQSVETFFHPSNSGTWTKHLTQLLSCLADFFVLRWNREQSGELIVPESRKLTSEIKRQFVLTLKDVVFMGIHSKSGTGASHASMALQTLAYMEPDIIIPAALEQIYPSMQGLVETHRTITSIKILSALSQIMIQNKKYRVHVTALLGLAIPGIDANDLSKTVQSLTFIQSVASYVPLVDLSDGMGSGLAIEYITEAIDSLQDGRGHIDVSESDSLAVLKSSTSTFGEFLISLLERVFTLLENLPDATNSRTRAIPEANVVNMLPATFSVVFGALSDELFELALERIVSFVSNHVIYQASDAMANLVACLAKTNPTKTLERFFEVLSGNIKEEIEENHAGSTNSTDIIPRDRGLIWYLSLIRKIVWNSGSALMKYRTELFDLLLFLRTNCKGVANSHASNLLHHTLYALTNIYHIDSRLINAELFRKTGYTLDHWGYQLDPKSLEVEWHVPSREEIEYAMEIFTTHVNISMKELSRLTSGSSTVVDGNDDVSVIAETKSTFSKEWSNEVTKQLTYIRLSLSGIAILFDPSTIAKGSELKKSIEAAVSNDATMDLDSAMSDGDVDIVEEADENVEGDEEASYSFNKLRTYPTGYFFGNNKEDPLFIKLHETHLELSYILHSVYEHLQGANADDVQCFKSLASVYRTWFIDVGVERSLKLLENQVRSYLMETRVYRISGLRKRYPRSLLVKRALIHHLERIKYSTGPRKMSDVDRILLQDLLQTSLSQYIETRRQSQYALDSAIRVLLGSRAFIIPKAIEELKVAIERNDFDRTKGAIHTLSYKSVERMATRDSRFYPSLVLNLIEAAKVDRPSVYDISRNLIFSVVIAPQTQPERVYYSSAMPGILEQIKPLKDLSGKIKSEDVKNKEKMRISEARLSELELQLAEKLESAHWRVGVLLLSLLLSGAAFYRDAPNPQFAAQVVKGCVSDHPLLRYGYVQSSIRLYMIMYFRAAAKYDMEAIINENYRDLNLVEVPVPDSDPSFTQKHISQFSNLKAPYFMDDQLDPGWLVWGKSFVALKNPPTEVIQYDEPSTKAMDAMASQISSEWFGKFINVLKQEPRPENDGFHKGNAFFSSTIFAMIFHGRTKIDWDEAIKMVYDLYGNGEDKNQHRAVAILMAGIFLNSTIPNYYDKAYSSMAPLFCKVVDDGLTPETLDYWSDFVTYLFSNIDMRLGWPIVQKLIEIRIDRSSNAAFKESSRISLLRKLISRVSWNFQLQEPIVKDLLANLDHSYKGVREEIGRTLGSIYKSRYYEAFPTVAKFLEENKRAGALGVVPYRSNSDLSELLTGLFTRLENWRRERVPLQEPSSYTSGSKTVMIWFDCWLSSPSCSELMPYFPKLILPELLHLLDVKEDTEVISLAVTLFKQFGNMPCPPDLLKDIIEGTVQIASNSTTWHQRMRVLAVVQVFYFRQLFELTKDCKRALFECVVNLLLDSQLEVRDSAATTLSGMIRCSPVNFKSEIIQELHSRFKTILLENPAPGKRNLQYPLSVVSSASSSRASTPSNEYNSIIILRHAAVLGLSALVHAFPYQSPPPKWVPEILTTLAIKAANDSGMVGQSVKTALGDFKKTRQDTWHVDMKAFSTEQLEDLEGVLWRNYFA